MKPFRILTLFIFTILFIDFTFVEIQCLFIRDGSDDKKLPALLREK